MPYLVLKGTRCRVITPMGHVVDPYICRRHTIFDTDEMKRRSSHLLFERRGFRLFVDASKVITFELACVGCGAMLIAPSLCVRCERMRKERR
jgi:hypothetical protein